jgi:nucleotide-binding universal stress UspA family protein
MGQHGDSATIDRALLGSVSEVVLEEASIPVMLM